MKLYFVKEFNIISKIKYRFEDHLLSNDNNIHATQMDKILDFLFKDNDYIKINLEDFDKLNSDLKSLIKWCSLSRTLFLYMYV